MNVANHHSATKLWNLQSPRTHKSNPDTTKARHYDTSGFYALNQSTSCQADLGFLVTTPSCHLTLFTHTGRCSINDRTVFLFCSTFRLNNKAFPTETGHLKGATNCSLHHFSLSPAGTLNTQTHIQKCPVQQKTSWRLAEAVDFVLVAIKWNRKEAARREKRRVHL